MMLKKIKKNIRHKLFLTSPISIIINPFYIIRNGLYKSISSIAPSVKGEILDFGCGSKPYESLFVNAKAYIGVDIKASGHDHLDSKIDFFYDGAHLPFPDESFDAIVCFEVLEHVFNINEILTELNRVLKPNGKLLFSIPFAWDEHEIPYDFARYTSYGIRHILEKNNFEVIALEKTTTYFLAVSQMFIAYLSQHVLPKNKILSALFQGVIVFPLTSICLLFNYLLPKRYEFFCNCVILSRKHTK
jgi:SAM-dependent methyltransferase